MATQNIGRRCVDRKRTNRENAVQKLPESLIVALESLYRNERP